jgi:hypothetical protein
LKINSGKREADGLHSRRCQDSDRLLASAAVVLSFTDQWNAGLWFIKRVPVTLHLACTIAPNKPVCNTINRIGHC